MSPHGTFAGLLISIGLMLTASAHSETRGEASPRGNAVRTGSTVRDQERRDRNPVLHWNRIANEIFPIDVGPVLDARAMAILHAAIHDAVNGIEPRYEPYTAALSFPAASLHAAVASAARDVLLALTPNQRARIEREFVAALAGVPDGPAEERGVLLGHLAARANLDRRAGDGIAPGPWPPQQGPITEPIYVPTGKPGDYDFTPPFDAPPLGPIALFPGLGRLTPFVIDLARHRLNGPDPLRSKRYARDLAFLTAYGRLEGSPRTPDQTETAFFWFEPFAIWNDIAATTLERQQASPWRAARVLALMNFALMDAGIACFDAKYQFRFWRPYTAIRRAGEDGNDDTIADPDWLPLLWTPPDRPLSFLIPPIPDYPSAAAMTSAAAAEVLTRHLGGSVPFAVRSVTLPGATRRFKSFSEAAREAGMSRVFGGIHFVHAVEDGWVAGKSIRRDIARALPRRGR
jgi:PAP2 superfamily